VILPTNSPATIPPRDWPPPRGVKPILARIRRTWRRLSLTERPPATGRELAMLAGPLGMSDLARAKYYPLPPSGVAFVLRPRRRRSRQTKLLTDLAGLAIDQPGPLLRCLRVAAEGEAS
jgi:hypothetical protein